MLKHQRGAVTAVMNMSLFVLLLLSGLLCSASGLWQEYQYINRNMTWTDAQSYCRERFTDLATVDSMDDVDKMMNTVNDGYSGSVWIGLQKGSQSNWVWSNGEDNISYIPWYTGEPNGGNCANVIGNAWFDYLCTTALRFVCYNEPTEYIKIDYLKNWTDAQSYCRQHYTDLATVHNSQEQKQLYAAVKYDLNWYWIGLYKEFWQWSDQWNFTFRNWAAGHPFISSGDCVAMSTTDSGKWVRYSCDQQYPFVCYGEDKLVKRQTVRLSLSNDGNYNLNDPSVQTAILNEISEKLKIMGLGGLRSISWRQDEVGKVFYLTTKRKKAHFDNVCKYIRN
ncbi:macrophage mannose receptor 1-like [Paramisgurnus dabryanus]|uniref:macrophage mannose receptor 1-like n=1 Tax=Paramisgurnus dabryanus TaxID=90735 RepID=UPI0031F4329C